MNRETRIFLINFIWKFFESSSSQLITFVVSVVLARILSPNDYGVVSLINVFIVIAEVFVTSGFGTSLVQKRNATKEDFSTIFYCNLIFSVIIYLLLYFFAPLIALFYSNSSLTLIIRVFSLRLPLSAFNSIQQAYVAKNMLFKKTFISTLCATIFSGFFGIFLAYNGFGVWALVGQYLSNAIVISIVLFLQIRWKPQLIFSVKSFKELTGFAWKMLLADLSGQVFFQLRSLLIGKFYTPSDLAFYNRGQNFPNLISNNIDGTISTVLFSEMSKYSNDRKRVKQMMRRAMKTSTFVIFPALLGMAAMSKQIILILLTEKWLPAVPYMQCLCVAAAFGTFSNENLQALKSIGKSDIILKLEFKKKPIFLLLLVISLKVSVFFLAFTMVLYDIYAMFVNMKPNETFLDYKIHEQIFDALPSFIISVCMSVVVFLIGLININVFLIVLIQLFLGTFTYFFMSKVCKVEALEYILKNIKSK